MQLSFDFYMNEAKPENLIGDRAYDSDALDQELKQDGVDGVELIAPHRSNRKLNTQDGRRLRRYERRRIVERFFAWIQWKRRLRFLSTSAFDRTICGPTPPDSRTLAGARPSAHA